MIEEIYASFYREAILAGFKLTEHEKQELEKCSKKEKGEKNDNETNTQRMSDS